MIRRCSRSLLGKRRMRAAKTARSAQSRRGRGLVRRSTATSCRSTSSSTSLVEDVRPSSRTSPSTCWKIRYNSRSDTAAIIPTSENPRSPLVSGVCHVLEPRGRELLRQLFQDHLDLRAAREQRLRRSPTPTRSPGAVETGHARALATVFGQVTVPRLAYRAAGTRTCTRPTRR